MDRSQHDLLRERLLLQNRQGLATFDNSSCSYDDLGMVPLNAYERENVGLIVKIERQKGCR
jgi:hypothetical protein